MTANLEGMKEGVDPQLLHVQWLDNGLLVHAITMAAPASSPHIHTLFAASIVSIGAGLAAIALGQVVPAVALAAVGAAAAAPLARRALAIWRAPDPLPPQRRLLVELSPTEISWTLLSSNRFAMQHDQKIGIAFIERAEPAQTPDGEVVRLTILGGSPQDIPMHGLPRADSLWLASRIGEAIAAVTAEEPA